MTFNHIFFSTVPELKLGEITNLEASDMYQMLTSPFYEHENVPMSMTKEWLLTAPIGNVITLEVRDIYLVLRLQV